MICEAKFLLRDLVIKNVNKFKEVSGKIETKEEKMAAV